MARPHPALLPLAAGRPLPPVADADALVRSAREHRMQGLLWHEVERGALALPRELAGELARDHLHRRAHHQRLWRALDEVTARLGALGIEVASFKGVTAEHRWYPGPGTRPCTDLDLLLRPRDVHRIRDIARELEPHASFPHLDVLVGSGILQSVDLSAGGIEVDLHADALKFEVPTRQRELLWERTTAVTAPGGRSSVRVLDAETSLVQLLLHLTKDGFARLLAYADVARLLRREELDWAAFDSFVRAEGLEAPVYAALDRVVATLDLRRPPVATATGARAALWRRLWPEPASLHGQGEAAHLQHRTLWLPFLARGRALEAARWWLRRRVLPPKALLPYYLPETRGPYLWRLVSGRLPRMRLRRAVNEQVRVAGAERAGREVADDREASNVR